MKIKTALMWFRKLYFWRKPQLGGVSTGSIFKSIFNEGISDGTKISSEVSDGGESVY